MYSQEYEDGEILVESEPIRYELHDIQRAKWRTNIVRNKTVLGSTILSNDGEYSNTVESVISYDYEKQIYWGNADGVARGLKAEVFEKNKLPLLLAKGWGLKVTEQLTEVRFHFLSICIAIKQFSFNINK